ncbi:MAG: hypothetical protein QM708_13520 [Propioniciclava sp.]|uniref:hypothetical protein n=1 Tax=Propioniciclava sp. TaxID=2038686 RepID=UPI0039E49852
MPAPLVKVEGAAQLRRTLRKAGIDISTLKAAHAQAGKIAAGGGQDQAPRRTGRLASTIRSSGTSTGSIIRAGYARVPYANPIHWGWPRRNISPNPFLTDGAQQTEPEWIEVYQAAIDEALNQVKGI